jgi:hypothetical protein
MTEQFANNASTTLNGAINNSTTTVVVTNGAVFSQVGTFRVIVDSEIMLVSAISGNTLTVARGQEGTSAVSHLTAATITQILTAAGLAQFKLDTSVGVMRAGSGDPNSTPSFVQGKNIAGKVVTTTAAVTAGNLLVVFVQTEASASLGSTPTDNLLTSYSLIASIPTGGTQVFGAVYAGIAPTSGICTVTGTQGTSFARTSVGEYKNANATVDNFNSGTAVATLNVTISEANSLVVVVVGDFSSSSTFTPGANFTSDFSANGADSAYYEHAVTSAIGTFAAAYTSTHGTAGNIEFAIVFHPTGTTTVGQDGDFYIDSTNKKLYGPRTSGVYPLIGTLT